jgi:hypothetical protein
MQFQYQRRNVDGAFRQKKLDELGHDADDSKHKSEKV